jgi:hypothetical protein
MFTSKFATIGKLDGVRVDETRVRAIKVEFPAGERFYAVAGKIPDDALFALVDRAHIGASAGYLYAEPIGMLSMIENLGSIEQGFRWHAAAQDTQSSELLGAVDDGGFLPQGHGDAGGVETGATTANADKIVSFQIGLFFGKLPEDTSVPREQERLGVLSGLRVMPHYYQQIDFPISSDFAGDVSNVTRCRPNSTAVPAPREVVILPSVTTDSSAMTAGSSFATE